MKKGTWNNDRATPDPGEYESITCGFCNSEMTVRRNVNGATGFAEAMGKMSHLHDVFECPFRETDWHRQVKALRRAAEETPSKQIEVLLLTEASGIVLTKKCTKPCNDWRI